MCDPNLLSNTTSVLRYLIKNGPAIRTVDSIGLDFYNYTHVQIGYSFLLSFLKSIPDVLQIDPITFDVRPAGTYQSKSPNRPPLTFPLVLPWTQLNHQEINETTSTMSPLGPRRDADGRCSSFDSIASDDAMGAHQKTIQNESVASAIVSNSEAKNDVDAAGTDVKNHNENTDEEIVPLASNSLNDEQCDELTEPTLNGVCGKLQKSLSICSDDNDVDLPSPQDNLLMSPSHSEEFDSMSPLDGEESDAIPMFDDEINLLTSCFFNGEFGSTIKTTNIDDIMKVGDVHDVFVSEVNSPFQIWFQLNDEVEEVQASLDECYNLSVCIPELIKPEYMMKGYACAALYDNVWHRGEITGPVKDGKVGIFFVDYGTVDQVEIGSVRYLLNSFCALPKLCHHGMLDFIKPRSTDQRWTSDARIFLTNLIESKTLTAGITEIDSKNNSVRMYLTNAGGTINVNCSMVYNCLAYPEDPRDRYQNHITDVEPLLNALETSQHVSTVAELREQHYNEELVQKSIEEKEEKAKERMEKSMTKKEEGQKRAEKPDAKVFLEMFQRILKNPFLNPRIENEVASNATNPFSD